MLDHSTNRRRIARILVRDRALFRRLVDGSPGALVDLLVAIRGSPDPELAGLSARVVRQLRQDGHRSRVPAWRVGRILAAVAGRLERHRAVFLAAHLAGRDVTEWTDAGERRPTYDPQQGRAPARNWIGVSRLTPSRLSARRPVHAPRARRRAPRVTARRLRRAIGPPPADPDPPEHGDAPGLASSGDGDPCRLDAIPPLRRGGAVSESKEGRLAAASAVVALPPRGKRGGICTEEGPTPIRRATHAGARRHGAGLVPGVPSCSVQCRPSSDDRGGDAAIRCSRGRGAVARDARGGSVGAGHRVRRDDRVSVEVAS